MKNEETMKRINEKYSGVLGKLDSPPSEESPYYAAIENLNVCKEALADAWDAALAVKGNSEEEIGRIGGQFVMAWHLIYHLKDHIEWLDYTHFDVVDGVEQDKKAAQENPEDLVPVEIDIDDRTMASIAHFAHNNGMTINDAINDLLRQRIDIMENKDV